MKIYDFLDTVDRLSRQPEPWGDQIPPVVDMAIRLIWLYKEVLDGRELRAEVQSRLSFEAALTVLSSQHQWHTYKWLDVVRGYRSVRQVLKVYGYGHRSLTLADLIMAHVVRNDTKADELIQTLHIKRHNYDDRGPMALALFEVLKRWSSYNTHGPLAPVDIKKLRFSLKVEGTNTIVTQPLMAEMVGLSVRQFKKYECGDLPIPDQNASRIFEIALASRTTADVNPVWWVQADKHVGENVHMFGVKPIHPSAKLSAILGQIEAKKPKLKKPADKPASSQPQKPKSLKSPASSPKRGEQGLKQYDVYLTPGEE